MRFSKQTQAFYPEDIKYHNLPNDVVICSDVDYQAALARTTGETLDFVAGKLVILPAPEKSLAQVKQEQSAIITAATQSAIISGFVSASLGASYSYPSTLVDQQNINAVALVGGALWCKNAAGVWAFAPHTKAQAAAVQADMVAHIQAQQIKNATLQAAIAAATAVDSVQSVVW